MHHRTIHQPSLRLWRTPSKVCQPYHPYRPSTVISTSPPQSVLRLLDNPALPAFNIPLSHHIAHRNVIRRTTSEAFAMCVPAFNRDRPSSPRNTARLCYYRQPSPGKFGSFVGEAGTPTSAKHRSLAILSYQRGQWERSSLPALSCCLLASEPRVVPAWKSLAS